MGRRHSRRGRPDTAIVHGDFRFVSPSFFSTLDVPVKGGRPFFDSDRGRRVAILSERAAQSCGPTRIRSESWYSRQQQRNVLSEVVGVVANVRTTGVENEGS